MTFGSTEAGPGRDVPAHPGARRVSDRVFARVEDVAWAALERIGIDLRPGDDDLVAALVPFVIDQESLHTIRPLQSVPVDFDVDISGSGTEPRFDIRYRNRPLPPVPVLAASLAPLLLVDLPALEVEFVDGHNVYGANRFERHEGRRLLRRAIGYVHEQLASDGDRFDIIAYEGDGFLIARPREAGRAPLQDRLRDIIAAMNGEAVDRGARRAIGDRLATFYKHASGTVLAPALVEHEKRDEATRFGLGETTRPGTAGERLSRLQSRFPDLCALLDAVRTCPLHEQNILLGLIEFRMFDPVLEPLTDRLRRRGCAIKAFTHPGELLKQTGSRSVTFYRVELLSLLKSLNEHPLGGFQAGNEALKTAYAFLVAAIQRTLRNASAGSNYEVYTFRRWGEFYFAVDSALAGAVDIAAGIEDAFGGARYLALDCRRAQYDTMYSATVSAVCPRPSSAGIIIPLMPAVTANAPISDDMLAMPIEEPASMRRAIARRLQATEAPEVDAVFLADWTLNACDAKRGIPRLIEIVGATWADVAELSRHYRSWIDRRGRVRHQIRRDAEAISGFTNTLRALCP